jgi:hypothetical protein
VPTKKTRINVSLDEEILNQVDTVMEEQGILERTSFVRNAVEYYLVALTTDDKAKAVVTKDTTKEIKRTINPLSSQLEENNRVTQIMLNAIWKKLNHDEKISDEELTKIVSDSIKEVDEDKGMSVNKILKSAKNVNQNFEAVKNFNQPLQQKIESNVIANTTIIPEKREEIVQPISKQENIFVQESQPIHSRFNDQVQETHEQNQNNDVTQNENIKGPWGNDIFSE